MALEELRPVEDSVDAHLLTEAIASDPLMTVKLLSHVAGCAGAGAAATPKP